MTVKKPTKNPKKTISKAKPGDVRLGSKFWRSRKTSGRKKIFETSSDIEIAAYSYFEWLEQNPIVEPKAVCHMGEQVDLKTEKQQAPTIRGLCAYLGIAAITWADYRSQDDFSVIIEKIENYMYGQKLAGAAAGIYNANIIARDLGLAEKTEGTLDIPQASQFDFSKMSPEARAELMKARIDGPDTD